MWFKQIQLYKLADSLLLTPENLQTMLEKLTFRPCLPAMRSSIGFVPVVPEPDAPFLRSVNQCLLICFQSEEKILPSTVIKQALLERTKQIEAAENRKIRQQEKLALQDDVIVTLLPRAFSKLSQIYCYFDLSQRWFVVGTTQAAKTEQLVLSLEKCYPDPVKRFEFKKISTILTHWLRDKTFSGNFSIEKTCVLQDPGQQTRIIRCQQQDLFANSIQALIKDGCEVKELALSWNEQIKFVLTENFILRNIQFVDEIKNQAKDMEPETRLQQLDSDFIVMSGLLSQLLQELLALFEKKETESVKEIRSETVVSLTD